MLVDVGTEQVARQFTKVRAASCCERIAGKLHDPSVTETVAGIVKAEVTDALAEAVGVEGALATATVSRPHHLSSISSSRLPCGFPMTSGFRKWRKALSSWRITKDAPVRSAPNSG